VHIYDYDYITKLCSQQAEAIENRENSNVHNVDKAKPDTENIRGLILAAVKLKTFHVIKQPL
jgi:hypothetical protein